MESKIFRILYVHNSADLYGASRSLLRLTGTLDRKRFEPVVVLPEEGLLAEALRSKNVVVEVVPEMTIISRYRNKAKNNPGFLLSIPLSVQKLKKIIRDKKIDLVHTNSAVILSGALAAKICGVPHVWHVREFFSEFKFRWLFYRPFMLIFSKKVVAVSKAAASQFGKSKKVDVIHNGFDLEQFKVDRANLGQQFKREYKITDNAFVVGCVGRIKFQRKGQDVFLRSLELLKKRGVEILGLIVGAPYMANEGEWERLRQLMKELGLTEKEVILTGELTDTKAAYAAMNVSVLPSATPEPFGGVVLESMGMQLPVLATNIGGSAEQVDDGVTGYLVPPNNPELLAERIDYLRLNKDISTKMGQAGYQRLKEKFSILRNNELIVELYSSILSRDLNRSI